MLFNVFVSGLEKIPFFSVKLFGNSLAQIVVFFGVIVVLGLLLKAIYGFFKITARSVINKTKNKYSDILSDLVEEPLILFSIGLGLKFVKGILSLNEKNSLYYDVVVKIILVLTFVWIIYKIIDAALIFYLRSTIQKDEDSEREHMFILLRKAMKFLVAIVVILVLLSSFGYNISGLLAGLGIGGLALAFAAHESLANIFGGISLIINRTYKLGDEVIIGDKKGIVYDIGPWNTKLKGENSEIITVPNKFATNSIIVNLGRKNRK